MTRACFEVPLKHLNSSQYYQKVSVMDGGSADGESNHNVASEATRESLKNAKIAGAHAWRALAEWIDNRSSITNLMIGAVATLVIERIGRLAYSGTIDFFNNISFSLVPAPDLPYPTSTMILFLVVMSALNTFAIDASSRGRDEKISELEQELSELRDRLPDEMLTEPED
ncbi:hypothetical protein ACFQJC_17355 [Haloferax namakaokahaiae]|uniref:Uncharacterized protein n=1 Tax=Haloferax namakaokahaiae TaxID=1748331 RepID=A0ABD5ZJC5_9EURY